VRVFRRHFPILLMKYFASVFTLSVFALVVKADTVIPIHSLESGQAVLGTITAKDTDYGLLLLYALKGLPSGLHGVHVHENPSCDLKGKAAGGHFDPDKKDKHQGPYDKSGHKGDLPVLYVNQDGVASTPVLAPRLKEKDLKGRSLIIHEKGDNYSDTPQKLGGGVSRIACGVVPE